MGLTSKKAALFSCAALIALSLGSAAWAAPRNFDVPAQDAVKAIPEFGRQAGVQLIAPADKLRGVRTVAVRGAMEVRDALALLLNGTGLEVAADDGRVIVLRMASDAQPTSSASDAEPPSKNDENTQAEATTEDRKVERVVVTGTHIRGKHPKSSPLETFTRKDIERSGATTTEQFIEKLPQNLGTRSQYSAYAVGSGGRINVDSIAGADLRGLGIGTTLVLLNGRRLGLSDFGRTADLSMIPVSAIERVEVLTDGASAIYGSDAIGGVINFVLRDDFDGAETRASYGGVTSGGLRQGDITQAFGGAWGSGHGLVSLSAYSASALEIADRSYAAAGIERGALTPNEQRQSLLATASQDLSDALTISADIVLSRRDTKLESGDPNFQVVPLNRSLRTRNTVTNQLFGNLALDYEISSTVHASLTATYSNAAQDISSHRVRYNRTPPEFIVSAPQEKDYSALDLTAAIDGSLFSLPGGDVRFSVGGGLLHEDYSGRGLQTTLTGTLGRSTTYAFGELLLPIVGADQSVSLVNRLELSLAARYTRYDDRSKPALHQEFGDQIDPKIGLLWAPIEELSLRGTYGTSFRAPSVVQLDETLALVLLAQDALPIPFPAGDLANLIVLDNRPVGDLAPEIATTYTLGFDMRPSNDPRLRVSATYYNISYEDRIDRPSFGFEAFQRPDLFSELLYRPPSAAFLESQIAASNVFDGFPVGIDPSNPAAAAQALFSLPNVWISDLRTRNLALSAQDGFDFSVSHSFETDWGEIRYGANVTRILSYRQSLSAGAPEVTTVDVATQPVDLRGRVFIGLSHGGFDGTLNINYVDDYANISTSSTGVASIDSWTTADLSLSYDFGDESTGLLHGIRLSLSAQNVFDQDPPFVGGGAPEALFFPVGFDPANANPLGRIVVVGLTKSW